MNTQDLLTTVINVMTAQKGKDKLVLTEDGYCAVVDNEGFKSPIGACMPDFVFEAYLAAQPGCHTHDGDVHEVFQVLVECNNDDVVMWAHQVLMANIDVWPDIQLAYTSLKGWIPETFIVNIADIAVEHECDVELMFSQIK